MIADILCEPFGSCSWKADLLERKPGVSDYETLQARRHRVVGVFVVVGLVAFGWLVLKFGDLPSGISQWKSFDVHVQFSSAPGVQRDTPVRFCGYQVGRVTKVLPPRRLPEIRHGQAVGPESYQTTVVMSIENEYTDIPLDSRIKLMTRGFGSSYIEIQPSLPDPCSPIQAFWTHGSKVQGSVGVTSELFPEQTQKQLEELLGDLRVFIGHANQIIGDPNSKQNIKATLVNLSESSKRTVQVLERAEQALSRATEAIEQYRKLAIAGQDTLRNADDRIDRLTGAVVQTSEELGRAASQMRQLIEKANEGEGTLGRLVNDGRLYENLIETTDQLQLWIQQFTSILEKLEEKGLRGVWKGTGTRR